MAGKVSTVWMVSARTGLEGLKGELTMRDRALVFQPESTRYGEIVFPLSEVQRVRRARGSPVLEIHMDVQDAPRVVGFYFVEPPPLRLPDTRLRLFPRYFARRSAISDLRKGNILRRDEMLEWFEEIERLLET
jgi:hypothetical protein